MNAPTFDPRACDTEALNALLRGEMAAVDAYTRAMPQFDDELVIARLQKIRDEHGRAVRELRDQVVRFGGKPAASPGPWPAFASNGAAAKALGPATALAALREGEEHRASEYEAALENDDIHPDCQRVIRTDLLAACRRHVEEVNRLLGGTNQ
jgi:hypothetical protein